METLSTKFVIIAIIVKKFYLVNPTKIHKKLMKLTKKFVDFMLSKEAQEVMSSIDFTVPVNPEAVPVKGSIASSELDLIEYNTVLAAQQKNQVLEYWSKNVK